jgi:dienelactone hydrolase
MRIASLLATLLCTTALSAAIKTETIDYQHNGTTCKGYLAYDDAATGKRPGVLIVHEWWGLDDYAKKRAERLAEMGYVAFAADMYGDGKVAQHPDEAKQFAGKVRENVDTWRGRAKAGLEVLKKNEHVNPDKLAAIGYCFGGATVLQLAYSGEELDAVVSFHGALPAATPEQAKAIEARILICHGAEDTFIPDEQVMKFRKPLSDANVDYQIIYYGGATHSFTVPGVEKRMPVLKYHPDADRRSWEAMKNLFDESFGK